MVHQKITEFATRFLRNLDYDGNHNNSMDGKILNHIISNLHEALTDISLYLYMFQAIYDIPTSAIFKRV